MSTYRVGEYKGHPTLSFGKEDDRFPFTFGIAKAKLLLVTVEELGPEGFVQMLKDFVKKGGE